MKNFIDKCAGLSLQNKKIDFDNARKLTDACGGDLQYLMQKADEIKRHFKHNHVHLCSIVNAKCGVCSENCKFCAQSAHYKTGVSAFKLKTADEIFSQAKQAHKNKSHCFGIVTSGEKINSKQEFDTIITAIKKIRKELRLNVSCSLGSIPSEWLSALKQAGLQIYHHNLETSESYFPKMCTTHTYQDRVATVKNAKALGLNVCCGGIFGIGEAFRDRVELAFALAELDVDSVPLNFLHPIKGTPFGDMKPLDVFEILKTIAVFRFILPSKDIKVCGGREVNLREHQPLLFSAGANGIMIGNYLTRQGQPVERDHRMIEELGLIL